eukprot:383976-Lingulodinium_polyedra.AAC.1
MRRTDDLSGESRIVQTRGGESRLSRKNDLLSRIATNTRHMCRIAAGSQRTRLSRKLVSDRSWIAARCRQ